MRSAQRAGITLRASERHACKVPGGECVDDERARAVQRERGRDYVGIPRDAGAEAVAWFTGSSPSDLWTVRFASDVSILGCEAAGADRIVSGMEEAFALVRKEHATMPRAVNLISGPSRTGDIEQTIVLGAHGPYRVHILVL